MPIDSFRVSEETRNQLIKLKRWTGIRHWNVLCRWGFCASLAEPTPPTDKAVPSDSNVEMTWKTFGGAYHELYLALLKRRCFEDGLELSDEILIYQFKLHVQRGVAYLAADTRIAETGGLFNLLSKK